MRVDLFDFELPPERIALRPARPRDSARLLVVRGHEVSDGKVLDLPQLLQPRDVLVFNDTKVIPAQLEGRREEGAVAAPTAALHFTSRLLEALDTRAIGRETLTLHVGAGTFLPVKAEDTSGHKMHAEWGRIDQAIAERLNAARASGGRLIAV